MAFAFGAWTGMSTASMPSLAALLLANAIVGFVRRFLLEAALWALSNFRNLCEQFLMDT